MCFISARALTFKKKIFNVHFNRKEVKTILHACIYVQRHTLWYCWKGPDVKTYAELPGFCNISATFMKYERTRWPGLFPILAVEAPGLKQSLSYTLFQTLRSLVIPVRAHMCILKRKTYRSIHHLCLSASVY